MKKDKILKSSLSTLLKRFSNEDVISNLSKKDSSLSSPEMISLAQIKDNSILKNARISEPLLQKACNLIKEKGIAEPLYVIEKDGHYEALYPRVLYKAAKRNKIQSIPCVLINLSEEEIYLFLAAKMLQDRDSNIVEMSVIFNKIKKKLKYSQKEIAQAMNLSRPQVTNIIRLINMPTYVLNDVVDGKLSFGHVRALSTLKEHQVQEIITRIYEENLSVHDVEKIVYELKHKTNFKKEEKKLNKKYKCSVNSTAKRVTFVFESEEDKEKFIKKISQ